MRKFFAFFLGFVMSLALLTGCGKSTATPTTDYHGEGEIQGGIKSDEDIAAITQEAEQNTEQPSYEDNTGHEPDAYGTGNFQDYWEGEDYFDLIGYLTDNGYKYIFAYDIDFNVIKDGQNIDRYNCYSNDCTWQMAISYGYIFIGYVGGDVQSPIGGNNCIAYSDSNNQRDVIIDQYGTKIGSNTLIALATVVDNINSDPTNTDPTRNAGFSWVDEYH